MFLVPLQTTVLNVLQPYDVQAKNISELPDLLSEVLGEINNDVFLEFTVQEEILATTTAPIPFHAS